ncbi:MAG: alpha/beta fold hydrolase [Sphaerochaetaceae bacterium]|nr:alpha/beta fold hydrolase [Sphaerochaetaceae bacterium]MDX9938964.1 alpha/beta fold hydrolase [Sphaerochaetaceae bacterium]
MMPMQEVPIRRCANPISLVHVPKSTRAVLCIHGYTGYPGELALPAKRLHEAGFDVFVPRLPGHGTNGEDFLRSTRESWLSCARNSYEDLAKRYDRVSLVGHSMGGAIAAILSATYDAGPCVLYAPALSIPALKPLALHVFGLFAKRKKVAWKSDPRYRFFDERDADDDAFLGSEYWSWLYIPQLKALLSIVKEAASSIGRTHNDILVITGGLDVTVGSDVGPMVVEQGKGKNNWIHLPDATHLIPYDIDDRSREDAMERTVAWMRWDD